MDIATKGSLNLKYWPCMIKTTHLSDEPLKLYCYPYSTFILELMPIAWPFSENQCKGTMFSAITEKYHQEPFQS